MVSHTVEWPLVGLTDEHRRDIGLAGLAGPIRDAAGRERLDRIGAGRRLVGFTGYLRFPRRPTPAPAGAAEVTCVAWAHCFRDPDAYLPAGVPSDLIALSDFTDPAIVSPVELGAAKTWDFAYVCQPGAAMERVKNWALALRCLPVLCGEMGLTGLLVGRAELPELDGLAGLDRLTVAGEVPWPRLMRWLRASRFLFAPNDLDPAPRIIAEALAMDTPVLVNRHILGGWHQVNAFTGAFFEDERDVAAGAHRCLRRWTSPRRWFAAHLGPLHSGRRLAALVRRADPQAPPMRRVHLSYRIEGR
jgi:glycosyltransferase involved in cell wall biosynthesis